MPPNPPLFYVCKNFSTFIFAPPQSKFISGYASVAQKYNLGMQIRNKYTNTRQLYAKIVHLCISYARQCASLLLKT